MRYGILILLLISGWLIRSNAQQPIKHKERTEIQRIPAINEGFLLTEDLEQDWLDNAWVNSYRTTYSYDGMDNNTAILYETWNDSDWTYESRYLMSYDEHHNITETISQVWENSDWVNSEREINSYDTENRETEIIVQTWNESDWINSGKTQYTYEQGNLVEELNQSWDMQWINTDIHFYSYDENNNQAQSLMQKWDGAAWENYQRISNQYNNNLFTQAFYEMWYDTVWSNVTLRTIQYNVNNNRVDELWQYWHPLNGWTDQTHWQFTYTVDNKLHEWLHQLYYTAEGWRNLSKWTSNYDEYGNLVHWLYEKWETNAWINYYQILSTYAPATSIEENIHYISGYELFQNYPNPFNPSTTISWNMPAGTHVTLCIYDVLGNKVSTLVDEFKPAGQHRIEYNPASKNINAASGIYYYQLKTDKFIQTRSMLLIK